MRISSTLAVAAALVCAAAVGTPAATDADITEGLKCIAAMRDIGEIAPAAAAAAQLVAKHPESVEVHIVHQDLELALGHDRDLVAAYRAAVAAPGATADLHFLCGRVLRGSSAIAELREALKADPAHFWAACSLGLELIRSKSFTEARTLLEDAAKRRPKSAVPVNALGRLEEARGKLAEAEKCYRAALELDPAMTVARVNLGSVLYALGRAADGKKELEDAASRATNDPMPLVALGMACRDANDEKGALDAFQRASSVECNDVAALNVLANAYLAVDDTRLAESALKRALQAAPGSLMTKANSAYLCVKQGQIEDAVKYANEAIAGDDLLADAHFALAMACERIPDAKKADAEYRRAAKLDEDNPEFARGGATYSASTGDWAHAISEYTRAAKLLNNSTDVLMELAAAYSGGQRASSAASTYDQIVAAEPAKVDAWLHLGIVCARDLKQYKRASKAFHEYVNHGGTDSRVPGWIVQLDAK